MIKQRLFKRFGTLNNKILPHLIVTGKKNKENVNRKQRQQREDENKSETVRRKLSTASGKQHVSMTIEKSSRILKKYQV